MNFEPAKTIDQLYFSNMIWWYWVCPQFYFVLIHFINEKVDGWFGVQSISGIIVIRYLNMERLEDCWFSLNYALDMVIYKFNYLLSQETDRRNKLVRTIFFKNHREFL